MSTGKLRRAPVKLFTVTHPAPGLAGSYCITLALGLGAVRPPPITHTLPPTFSALVSPLPGEGNRVIVVVRFVTVSYEKLTWLSLMEGPVMNCAPPPV